MPVTLTPSPLLRTALLGDAAVTAAVGLLLAAEAHSLSNLLLLPESLLRGAGLVVLPYAALMAWLALRPHLPRWTVQAVVAVNLLWVADSILLLGFTAPSGLGIAFVLLQAAVGLGFATAQWAGMQRGARMAIAA